MDFNTTISKIRPKLVLFARSFISGNSAATPDDVVQDALMKVLQAGGFEGVKNPEAFMRKVLKNICLDYLKLKKNNLIPLESVMDIKSEQNLVNQIELKEKYYNVRILINKLPDNYMLTLRLRDIMGYEFNEIAEILNTTEGNVRTILMRARKEIREKMTIYYEENKK